MDLNTGLSFAQVIIGLIALLGIGGAATYFIRKSSRKQSQKTGNNSVSIQSGRDTNIDR